MDCRRADYFIMKYLDGSLSAEEREKLQEHMSRCELCRENFKLYDLLMKEPSAKDTEAVIPTDFESIVMSKLDGLGCFYEKRNDIAANMFYFMWGLFSVLCGMGMFLALNFDKIIDYLYSTPFLRDYAAYFVSADTYISRFKNSFAEIFNQFTVFFGTFGDNMSFVVFSAFLMLFAAHILSLGGVFTKNLRSLSK